MIFRTRYGGMASSPQRQAHRACSAPHAPGTSAGLAARRVRKVAMSRTSFALRFKAIAGVASLTYLLNLRMRFAQQGLREGSMSVSELGLSLGYTTESAFSNAFKRTTGMAPKRYQNVFAGMDRSTSRKGDRVKHSSNLRRTAVRKALHAR